MSVRQDKIQLTVEINGKKAGGSLKELQATAKGLKQQLLNTTDPKKAAEYAASLKKVNGRMKDIWAQTRNVKKETSAWAVSLKAISFAAVAAGVGKFVKSLWDSADGIESLRGKAKTVFGEVTAVVEASAEKQAIALGLTRQEYVKSATAAGDLLIPMGFQRKEAAKLSTDLVGLSGALSAWSNGEKSATEVSGILTKALLGEREQLKTLGISIQEADVKGRLMEKGQSKLTGTTLQQAKAVATLELINEKSADAQDKFNNGTKTNIQRKAELSAKIRQVVQDLSEKLLPVFTVVLGVVEKGASGFLSFVKSMTSGQKATGEFAGIINYLTGLLNIQFEIWKATISIVTFLGKAFLSVVQAARDLPIIGGFIDRLVLGFNQLVFAVTNSKAVFAGMKAAFSAAIDGVRKQIFIAKVAFEIFAKQAELALTIRSGARDKLKADIASLENLKDLAKQSGQSVGDAYREAYEKSATAPPNTTSSSVSSSSSSLPSTSTPVTVGGGGRGGRSRSLISGVASIGTINQDSELIASAETLAAERLKILESGLDAELDAIERNFLLGIMTEEEANALKLERMASNKEAELLALSEFGLSETELYRKTELEKLEIQKDIDQQAVDQAKRTADLKKMLQEEGLRSFNDVTDATLGLLAKDEEARKKNAGLIKAFETAKILVNAKVEISEIFKKYAGVPFGTLIAAAQSIGVGLRSASAISAINSQSFYTGGRVLPQFSGQRINAASNIPTQRGGDSVLATLMPGEVVLNADQQRRAGGAAFFSALGVPGFNTGGAVLTNANTTPSSAFSQNIGSAANNAQSQMMDNLSNVISNLTSVLNGGIKSKVVYNDITEVGSELSNIKKLAAL